MNPFAEHVIESIKHDANGAGFDALYQRYELDDIWGVLTCAKRDVEVQLSLRNASLQDGNEDPDAYRSWRRAALRYKQSIETAMARVRQKRKNEARERDMANHDGPNPWTEGMTVAYGDLTGRVTCVRGSRCIIDWDGIPVPYTRPWAWPAFEVVSDGAVDR